MLERQAGMHTTAPTHNHKDSLEVFQVVALAINMAGSSTAEVYQLLRCSIQRAHDILEADVL